MDFQYLFTSFKGRINRQPYWQGLLVLILASIILSVGITVAIVNASGGFGAVLVLSLIGLLIFAASAPLTVKRLHDRGKSGHYAWLFYGAIVGSRLVDSAIRNYGETNLLILIDLTVAVIGIWFFVELGFFRGTTGPNAYGPDPLETA